MDLCEFIKGKWNFTGGFLDQNGNFIDENFFVNFTFNQDINDNYTFHAHINSFNDQEPFDVRVVIDQLNNQSFIIEKYFFPKSFIIAHGEIKYGSRNMPHAYGQWMNNSQHYKISILSNIAFELSIFRPKQNITNVYRFVKTLDPKPPSVTTVLKSVGFVFFFYFVFKITSAKEIINNHNKEQQAKNKKENQQTKPDKKND